MILVQATIPMVLRLILTHPIRVILSRYMSLYISIEDILYFRRRITAWGKQNYENYPWRSTKNPWHALVAEVLLQRTKAEQVKPIYNLFEKKYLTPLDYLADDFNPFLSLGLHWRHTLFKQLCEILSKREVPQTRSALLKLPGVGDYVASAFLSFHCNFREAIIDSNVVRVYGRFFGFDTDPETRRKKLLREFADRMTPKRTFRDFNYGLLDFAMKVCRQKALHEKCPVRKRCNFFEQN